MLTQPPPIVGAVEHIPMATAGSTVSIYSHDLPIDDLYRSRSFVTDMLGDLPDVLLKKSRPSRVHVYMLQQTDPCLFISFVFFHRHF